jgi:hypothetical protein
MKALVFIVLILPMLLACDNKANNVHDDSKVVARVGDVYITHDELQLQLQKLTGLTRLTPEQKNIRDNVLESLVLSRLMSQKQASLMSQDEILELEQEVNSYREERLTQKYLSQHVVANPPSKEQVNSFYEANLHRFGGGYYSQVEYWLLTKDCQFKNHKKLSNQALKKQLLTAGCNQSQYVASELNSKLANVLGVDAKDITENKAFWFTANEGQKVAFVESIEQRKAQPLVEVVASIRKMLAPMQLKLAIDETKSHLIKEMEVEYFD